MPTAAPVVSADFAQKVAALRRAQIGKSFSIEAFRPENDPRGEHAYAFVRGLHRSLVKEAGFHPLEADGVIRALAEIGGAPPELTKTAFLDGMKLDPNAGWGANAGQWANAAYQHFRHPVTSNQAVNIATSSPTAQSATGHIYNHDVMGLLGDAGHLIGDKIKSYLPQSWGGAVDSIGKQLTPENMKAWAPHVLTGLGTYAAGRMMGLGNLSSAGLGIAGGYGLPKLYDEFSKLKAPTAAAAPVHPGAPTQPAAAPAAAVPSTQAKLDASHNTAGEILHAGTQVPMRPAGDTVMGGI